jgi:WXXGXW repeat (2 copies)
MMSMRNVLLCLLVALSPVTMAVAAVNINIDIGVPPPVPRYEVVPPPRPGYVWAPGYWRWEGRRHVWVAGNWMGARPGYYWVPPRWDPRDGRHHFESGRWERNAERGEREREGKGRGWAKGQERGR